MDKKEGKEEESPETDAPSDENRPEASLDPSRSETLQRDPPQVDLAAQVEPRVQVESQAQSGSS